MKKYDKEDVAAAIEQLLADGFSPKTGESAGDWKEFVRANEHLFQYSSEEELEEICEALESNFKN